MKPIEIKTIMNMALKARLKGKSLNPLFVGPPGLGKSEIIQEWCKEQNIPFIDFRLAYREAPDVIGLPVMEVRDGRQLTTYYIPEFWPSSGRGVLFLDEVNRGQPAVMNTIMQLLTDRKVDKYKLPDEWVICAAINPDSVHYDVNSMDFALRDRFEIYEIEYDKKTFVEFMESQKWHEDIIMYVKSNTYRYTKPENIGNEPGSKYTSPRTLSKLNTLIQHAELYNESEDIQMINIEGVLGRNQGLAFWQFVKNEKPVTFEDLVKNTSDSLNKLKKYSDPDNYKMGHISITTKDILDNIENNDEEIEKLLIKTLLVIPADIGFKLLEDISFKFKNTKYSSELMVKEKKLKEHFKGNLIK